MPQSRAQMQIPRSLSKEQTLLNCCIPQQPCIGHRHVSLVQEGIEMRHAEPHASFDLTISAGQPGSARRCSFNHSTRLGGLSGVVSSAAIADQAANLLSFLDICSRCLAWVSERGVNHHVDGWGYCHEQALLLCADHSLRNSGCACQGRLWIHHPIWRVHS